MFSLQRPARPRSPVEEYRDTAHSDYLFPPIRVTHLGPDMFKVDAQFLQQWRLAVITLCPKRSQPASPQPALLAHPPAHTPSRRSKASIATANRIRLSRGVWGTAKPGAIGRL